MLSRENLGITEKKKIDTHWCGHWIDNTKDFRSGVSLKDHLFSQLILTNEGTDSHPRTYVPFQVYPSLRNQRERQGKTGTQLSQLLFCFLF